MKSIYIILPLLLLVLSACGGKKTANELFDEGEALTADNKFSEAALVFEELINEYPDDKRAPDATARLASIYQNKLVTNITATNSLEKAVRLFYSIYERYPDSEIAPMGLFMTGFLQANELNDYEEATKTYNKFLELYPDHELATSAKEELANMGLTPEEILKKNLSVKP